MDTLRAARFAAVVADIQKRWGRDALVPLSLKPSPNRLGLATRFPALNALLPAGGLPLGQLTEVLGDVSSGATSFCLSTLAHAQSENTSLRAAYIDLGCSFDAAYAAQYCVDLARLLIVRPSALDEAFDICGDLVTRYGAGLLLVDMSLLTPPQLRRAVHSVAFRRLTALLRKSSCVVLCLLRPQPGTRRAPVALAAELSLLLERTQWIQRYGCVSGVETRVTILKQSDGLSLRQTTVRLAF